MRRRPCDDPGMGKIRYEFDDKAERDTDEVIWYRQN